MVEIEFRIFIDEEFHRNFDSWYTGDNKDRKVKFTYHNAKTDKDVSKTHLNFHDAICLARRREQDGRYKNFEFLIEVS